MLNSVIETIEKHNMLSLNDRVVVAVSGGPDSMALLHVLCSIKERYNLYIHAAHLNHMLRGQESDQDTLYVQEFCTNFHIPLSVRHVDVQELADREGLSLEEAGRKARYKLFLDTASEVEASKIALAHNMNDQAETILMRIMRGTGLEGLCGIKPVREGLYIRPLLYTLRSEIEDYCRVNGLKPRIDSTNLKPIYARNRIRLQLIPYMRENFNSAVEQTLSSMADLLTEDNNFLEEYTLNTYKDIVFEGKGEASVDIEGINCQHSSIKKRVVRRVIEYVKGNLVGIESRHIDLILSAAGRGFTGGAVELPGGIKAVVRYNRLNIIKSKGETKVGFCYDIEIPGITHIRETGGTIKAEILDDISIDYRHGGRFIKYFDWNKLEKQLLIRSRRVGDYMVPLGMKGKKKIKDIFIDIKIPREERDAIPLVSSGNEIIWAVGYKVSDSYKISEDTKRVLRLEYIDSPNCSKKN